MCSYLEINIFFHISMTWKIYNIKYLLRFSCNHWWTILFNDQLDAQFFFVHVYFSFLHVSSIQVLIRGFNCINTKIWYMSLYVGDGLVCRFRRYIQTCIPDNQSDIYQISYWYSWIPWWWALGCSKHVKNWNKHVQKRNVHQVGH